MLRVFMVLQLIFIGVIACQAPYSIEPEMAQRQLQKAWELNQHAVWEIDWPNAPVGGTVVVEYWQFDNQYRFEILEATSARLVGEILISNGNSTWRYNRFKFDMAVQTLELTDFGHMDKPTRQLSPVTDLFSMIGRLLRRSTTLSAQQQLTSTLSGSSKKIELLFADQTRLVFWLDLETNLPLQVKLITGYETILIKAQSDKPLIHPLYGLFSRPDTY